MVGRVKKHNIKLEQAREQYEKEMEERKKLMRGEEEENGLIKRQYDSLQWELKKF